MKKLLFSLVLTLTDGATNAGCALALQFVDSCTILLARPHIGRDDDIVECFGAVSNFLTCTWLVVPVIFQGAVISLFSDQLTMMLALFSTAFAAAVSILTPFMAAVKWLSEISANLVECLGPAADGLAIFFLHIGAIAEGEMRDKMNRKYLRDLNKEEKCIRLQLLLQTHLDDVTSARKIPPKNVQQFAADALGFSAHTHERKAQDMTRAVAMIADVPSQKVNLELQRGPEYARWLDQVSPRRLLSRRLLSHRLRVVILLTSEMQVL